MSLKTRIFLVFAVAIGAGFYFLVGWLQDDLRPRYLESLEEPLVDMANLLAEVIAAEMDQDGLRTDGLRKIAERVYARRFKAQIYALEKQRVDVRIYVTDPAGTVIFDSDHGRDEGRDYSRWNDVYRSLRGEYGARSSHDDPLYPGSSVLYVAAPILMGGELKGVVSVGKPSRNVDLFLAMAKSKIAVAGAIAAILVLTVGLVFYVWVTRPLEKLVSYARAVKEGRRVVLPPLGSNEIGAVGTAMEEMRVALEGKDYAERYVQSLTHELKSPLAAIRAAAELLQEDLPPDQRARFAANIRAQALRLHDLVERLLQLASLEKRQALERPEPVDLPKLVGEAIEGLRGMAAQRDVRFSVIAPPGPDLHGDHLLLQQALINLLRNALAFSPPGGDVAVAVTTSDVRVCVEVTDQGPGIPEYALDKVFERFYSLPAPGQDRGSGLGLSFVREVAELHGGEVRVENLSTGGAWAILCLPLASAHETTGSSRTLVQRAPP